MRIRRDLGRRGFAGAYGPDGLIRDDDFRELLLGESGNALLKLADQHLLGVAALALFEALADAHDRRDAELERRLRPLQDRIVSLVEILPAFAVAHNGVRDTD